MARIKIGGIYWTGVNRGETILKGEKFKIVEIEGNMPKDSKVIANDISREEATKLAKKYMPSIEDEKVLYAYDIAIENGNTKYEPNNFGESVDVKLKALMT